MKKIKCNSIFVDPENDKQVKWVIKMKFLHLIKNSKCWYDEYNDGVIVTFSSPIKSYIIWRNNRFLGKDLMTAAYKIPRE